MKRTITIIAIVMIAILGAILVKLTVPLSYREYPVYKEAVDFVTELQKKSVLTAEQVAIRYDFYHTDYENTEMPKRIQIKSKPLNDGTVRVTIFDPCCEDDSIFSSIERIYMRKDTMGRWQPTKVEFSHKGRGRFGWTTRPTS